MKKKEKDIPETEETVETPMEEATLEEVVELTQEEMLQNQLAELNDKYLRLAAEYDNFRKRSQREKEAIYPEAVASTIAKVLPVVDNFGRAMESPCSDAEFKKGLSMIAQGFDDMFTKVGMEAFGQAGDSFDPNMHNAIMHVEDGEAEANTVVEVFQKGYKIGDRVIRHAMVKVAN